MINGEFMIEWKKEKSIKDVVEIINMQGEITTVYKLVDGRYMNRTNTVYIYDGKDTWTDTNGVEWNQEVK